MLRSTQQLSQSLGNLENESIGVPTMNIRMTTRGKRPLHNLTPTDKVRAIQRIHNGETKASVARDIKVPESTLRGWCKNEQKLRFMCRQLVSEGLFPSIPGIANPPEKRRRFENLVQTPKDPTTSSFDEFEYNRLSENRFSFSPHGSNSFLEEIALNEIIQKHVTSPATAATQAFKTISTQKTSEMGSSISISGDYNSQISLMQNLNLLSLLNLNMSAMSNFTANESDSLDAINNKLSLPHTNESTDVTTNDYNGNNSRNWAKEPEGECIVNQNIKTSTTIASKGNSIGINCVDDSNTNNGGENNNEPFSIEAKSDNLSVPLAVAPGLSASDNINNTALLEWLKLFSASLNFLTLAAAAAALQPNNSMFNENITKKEEKNLLHERLVKTANMIDAANNLSFSDSSNVSNDCNFNSQPEDLSVQSTITSKLTSPSNNCCEIPDKSKGSCSPLPSDGKQ